MLNSIQDQVVDRITCDRTDPFRLTDLPARCLCAGYPADPDSSSGWDVRGRGLRRCRGVWQSFWIGVDYVLQAVFADRCGCIAI